MTRIMGVAGLMILVVSCRQAPIPLVQQWTSFDIVLTSASEVEDPYVNASVWATFRNDKGDSLVRPAFWNGGRDWIIRFAPPDTGSTWQWTSHSTPDIAAVK